MIGHARLEIVRTTVETGTIGPSCMWLELPPPVRINAFLFLSFSKAEQLTFFLFFALSDFRLHSIPVPYSSMGPVIRVSTARQPRLSLGLSYTTNRLASGNPPSSSLHLLLILRCAHDFKHHGRFNKQDFLRDRK